MPRFVKPVCCPELVFWLCKEFSNRMCSVTLTGEEKVKNTLLNVLMEPNQYKVVKNFKAGSIAIANARSNAIKAIENACTITKKSMSEKSGDKNKGVSNEIASLQSSNNKLRNTVNILSEALVSEGIQIRLSL